MVVAITGGIGSGKTFVCQLLSRRGISVYDCDEAAKRLIRTDTDLQQRLLEIVGADLFPSGELNKAMLSKFILSSEENALAVDSVVHPAVAADFLGSGCQWIESAILFESGFDERISPDFTICVVASLETRIRRIMERDNLSRDKALEWIDRQMDQQSKASLADFCLYNDDSDDPDAQLEEIINQLAVSSSAGFVIRQQEIESTK